jgi:hypothetical protein
MINLSRGVLFFSLLILSFQTVGASNIEKIDINSASVEDLVKIIHIGKVRAEELIYLRPFSSLDDLIRIKGIGEAKLEDIKKQGLAWVPQRPQNKQNPEPINYASGIVINEILPSPDGPDTEEEWIEIFNQNNFEVDLANWQIVDTIGTTKTYTFPEDTLIKPKGYLVLHRPVAKITLNNSGDGLKLIQPDGEIADFVEYGKAPRGESYNLAESDWAWSNALTPGSINIIPLLAIEEKAKSENKEEKWLAAISQPFQEGQEKKTVKSPLLFLTALFVAIFSGTIILFLKKQLKINYNKNL